MPSEICKNSRKKRRIPARKSTIFNQYILPFLPNKEEKNCEDESKILSELIKNIFTGNEIIIKESYATLVAYLVMNRKDISYDRFVGSYESIKIGCDSVSGICSALPYCALISSGVILKWEPEHINLTIFKLLKIYQKESECTSVVFHFLAILINNLKTVSTHKLNKVKVNSLIQLHFLLRADSKRDESSLGNPVFDVDNILDITEIFLQESQDQELVTQVATLLAKKLLTFPDDTITEFWEKIINSSLNPRTDYKELAILHLLAALLENYDQTNCSIQQLFTPALIKMLSKVNPKIEQVFKKINLALKNLSEKLSGDTKLSITDVIIVNTEKYLDKILAVKIIDTLTAGMNFEEISTVVESLKQIVTGEKHKAKHSMKHINDDFNEFEKIYAVRCIGKLIGHNSCKLQVDWRKVQIKFLFEIGFLSEHKVSIQSHIAGVSRKTFNICLNQKFSKLADFNEVLKKLVKFAGERMSDAAGNFVVPFKEPAVNLWIKAKGVIKGMNDENEDTLIFKVLLHYMMLFLFTDYRLAKSSLEELFKVIENKEVSSGQLHWTEVIVDLFLHLLSGENSTHRNVINSTFGHICKHMTEKGLGLILNTVMGKDSSEDEMEEDASGDDEGSDASENDEGNSSGNDDGTDESDVDSNEEKEGQIDKLKDALRQELYKVDTASTCGSVDLDDIDPEEGKQLNATLGEIFKEQHTKYKSSIKNKVDNLEIHFRIRVLDLLETFIESKPPLHSLTVILTTAISLLKTSVPNHTLAPLTVSLKKCLKKLTHLKDFSNRDCVTETSLCSILNQILDKDCPVSVYNDLTEQIVESCLFLIRASFQLEESGAEISDFMVNTLNAFFNEANCHIPFDLFTSLISTFSLSKLIDLVPNIIGFAYSKKIKIHKRTQALQLLITFYNNNRLFKNNTDFENNLAKFETKILAKSNKVVRQIETFEINKKYCCMFLDLLCLLKTKNKTNDPGTHWDHVTEIIDKLSVIPLFQNELRVSFINFCKIFNYDSTKQKNMPSPETESKLGGKKKRKSSEIIDNSKVESLKKKKKKNNQKS